MNINILKYDSLDSTNSQALEQARDGAAEGLCIVAREQTAGRGRLGRKWVSEKNDGLYFSIVLRPKIDTRYLSLITLVAGVAVYDALSEIGLRPDIKWVNDVHVDGKKISGILAETTETKNGLAVIVGIGINIRSSNLPLEVFDLAAAVEDSVGKISFETLTGALIKFLVYFYDVLQDADGPSVVINEWRKRSSYYSGKPVRVLVEDEAFTGVTDGLEDNGALRIKREDGTVSIVQAGDVENLRAADTD